MTSHRLVQVPRGVQCFVGDEVLRRRAIAGGTVVTESFAEGPRKGSEGFAVDSVFTGGNLRPDIVKDLKLALPEVKEKPAFISLQPDGNHLTPDAESI